MQAFEANFDGLVGPTHNYAGLSFGNVASRNNEKSAANPKAAAKQGLRKMKQLADLGFHQGGLPPLERPSLKLRGGLALPGTPALGDEGAANHTRFCNEYGEKGVEFFVYGRSEYAQGSTEPKRYPA